MHALQSRAHSLITELLGLRNAPLLSKTWNGAVYLEALGLFCWCFLFPLLFLFFFHLPSIYEDESAAQVFERSLQLFI